MSGRARIAPELQRYIFPRESVREIEFTRVQRELRALLAVVSAAARLQASDVNGPEYHSARSAISRALARLERASGGKK